MFLMELSKNILAIKKLCSGSLQLLYILSNNHAYFLRYIIYSRLISQEEAEKIRRNGKLKSINIFTL